MKIAVVGTGNMGSALAEALLASGHTVVVWNRTEGKARRLESFGAHVSSSPAEAIGAADGAILALFDGAGTRRLLLDEAVRPALAGRRLINVSATLPQEIIEISDEVAQAGGILSEMTPTVYPDEVRRREAHIVFACQDSERAFWASLLSELGPKVHYAGRVGDASKFELVLWLSYMFNTIAIAFPVAAAHRLGVPMDIVRSSLSENPTVKITNAEHAIDHMLSRHYPSSMWTVDNFSETMDMIIEFASSVKLPTELLYDIQSLYRSASNSGFGGVDVSAVFEALLERGTERAC